MWETNEGILASPKPQLRSRRPHARGVVADTRASLGLPSKSCSHPPFVWTSCYMAVSQPPCRTAVSSRSIPNSLSASLPIQPAQLCIVCGFLGDFLAVLQSRHPSAYRRSLQGGGKVVAVPPSWHSKRWDSLPGDWVCSWCVGFARCLHVWVALSLFDVLQSCLFVCKIGSNISLDSREPEERDTLTVLVRGFCIRRVPWPRGVVRAAGRAAPRGHRTARLAVGSASSAWGTRNKGWSTSWPRSAATQAASYSRHWAIWAAESASSVRSMPGREWSAWVRARSSTFPSVALKPPAHCNYEGRQRQEKPPMQAGTGVD